MAENPTLTDIINYKLLYKGVAYVCVRPVTGSIRVCCDV